MDETYRHCSKENDQHKRPQYLFTCFLPSETHSGESNRRKGIRRIYKKEVEERRKSKIMIGGVLSLSPPVTGESGLLGVPRGK